MNVLSKIEERLSELSPGERYVYHQGLLARDRTKSFFVNEIAKLFWQAHLHHKVILTQRRLDHDHYQYIAIGR